MALSISRGLGAEVPLPVPVPVAGGCLLLLCPHEVPHAAGEERQQGTNILSAETKRAIRPARSLGDGAGSVTPVRQPPGTVR